jgi:ketosteroid isomerase-like protein
MSRENVETIRRWVDAFNAGGLEAVMERYWHEHIEMLDPESLPDAGRHVGKEAVRRRVESFFEVGWDGEFRIEQLIDAGDEVVMTCTVGGRTPVGDMPYETSWTAVLLVEDGKVRRMRQYFTSEEALESVSLASSA